MAATRAQSEQLHELSSAAQRPSASEQAGTPLTHVRRCHSPPAKKNQVRRIDTAEEERIRAEQRELVSDTDRAARSTSSPSSLHLRGEERGRGRWRPARTLRLVSIFVCNVPSVRPSDPLRRIINTRLIHPPPRPDAAAAAMSNPLPNASSSSTPVPDAPEGRNASSPPPSVAGAADVPVSVNPWDVALCVAGTLVSCENALVIALVAHAPAPRAPAFVLIASLALADLLAGLGLVLNFAVVYAVAEPGVATLLSAGLLIAAFSASVLNVLAITVDRYLSLYGALTYHTERAATFTYAVLALAWLTSALLGALPALGWNCLEDEATCSVCRPVNKSNAAALAVSLLLVFALILQLYLQICKIAFRHAQQIAVQRHFMSASHASSTTKGVSTLSAILGTFALCWVPFAMYSLVADTRYPAVYTYATALPAICSSIINPIIYAFRNPEIQRSLRLACCGCLPYSFTSRPRTPSDV
ncbi:hypothetical protein MHYP_G00215100 [Metynnis hypsauchen]